MYEQVLNHDENPDAPAVPAVPAADKGRPAFDPDDMEAADSYYQVTKSLFAQGRHAEAYARYMSDPTGGARPEFSSTTQERYVAWMYSNRDVQGEPVFPQPHGYEYAGFRVGQEVKFPGDVPGKWTRVEHIFAFHEAGTYVSSGKGKDRRLVPVADVAHVRRQTLSDADLLAAIAVHRAGQVGEVAPEFGFAKAVVFAPKELSYTPWRHGGWYAQDVTYPSGAMGCVSKNYEDNKWRIVCDCRRGEIHEPGDFTFKTREEAARAEHALALALWRDLMEAGPSPVDRAVQTLVQADTEDEDDGEQDGFEERPRG